MQIAFFFPFSLCDNNFSLVGIGDCVLLCSRYSASLYETWTETVGESSQYNLSLPLISRDPATRLISVNFNPQVFTSGPHGHMEKLIQDRMFDVLLLVDVSRAQDKSDL